MPECIPGPVCALRLGESWVDDGTMMLDRSPGAGPSGMEPPAPARARARLGTIGAREVVWIEQTTLAGLHPNFATLQKGWSQRVEAIYTRGKADPVWREGEVPANDTETAGVTVRTSVRKDARHYYGLVAVDANLALTPQLSMIGSLDGRSRLVSSARPLNEVRSALARTLVHELYHVLQRWVDDDFARKYREAGPYAGNRYEHAAFRVGSEWEAANRQALGEGRFDHLFPSTLVVPGP